MTVREVATILAEHHISALPIVDQRSQVVGIVSEGDLIRRAEIGTQKHRSWWLSLLTNPAQHAEEYVRAHGRKVDDLMTREVISVGPETPLPEIATLFERHNIKRVPVTENGKLVGIVTRGNLVQAIATAPQKQHKALDNEAIRQKILKRLEVMPWVNSRILNITVDNGNVLIWGFVRSEAEKDAIRVVAEGISGVTAVINNVVIQPAPTWD